MSCSITYQELSLLTQELMIKEGIKEYDLHIRGHSGKGENYLSDVTFFSVLPRDKMKEYNLVMKTAKRSEEFRELMSIGRAYQRESFMYQVVFPEMRKFLESAGNKVQLDHVAKMYSVCDDNRRETLILENLNYLGYQVLDRQKSMDMKHVILVLQNLAKHHAISLAMKKKVPKIFEGWTENLMNIYGKMWKAEKLQTIIQKLFTYGCELLKRSDRKDLAKKYEEKIKNNVVNILIRDTPVDDRIVICHGDCWNNNILFKYENSGDLSGVCFVDYQISLLDSPVKDVSFFLYTACDKSLLDNFEFLLQTYYSSFSGTLESLECNSCDFFTYSELLEHWQKYATFGLIMSPFFLKIELICTEEVPETGVDPEVLFNLKMKNEDLYNRRVLDVFTHYGDKFL